ncbi:MAG: NAD(P)-dependent oxidoreductase [Moraxella osloensis]
MSRAVMAWSIVEAVADAVTQGKLLGYGADVFEDEPIKDNDPLLTLKDHPRVIFTRIMRGAASMPSLTYGTPFCVQRYFKSLPNYPIRENNGK